MTLTMLSAIVGVTGGTVAVTRQIRADQNRGDLSTVQRLAAAVTIGNADRSHACPEGGISCWTTQMSVRAALPSVQAALHAASGRATRVRCFPHETTGLGSAPFADSCTVDVRVGSHFAFAVVDPLVVGPTTRARTIGATVSMNAD